MIFPKDPLEIDEAKYITHFHENVPLELFSNPSEDVSIVMSMIRRALRTGKSINDLMTLDGVSRIAPWEMITSTNGTKLWGVIPDGCVSATGERISVGDIYFQYGNNDWGLASIENNYYSEFADEYYFIGEEVIYDVSRNYNVILKGDTDQLLLVRRAKSYSKHVKALLISPVIEDDFYYYTIYNALIEKVSALKYKYPDKVWKR